MTPTSRRIYDKFRNSSLDPSAAGIIAGSEGSLFAATPADATIVAWAESYGIHFCTISETDDTIYMVEPNACGESSISPVAANILEFFGLLVACKHVSVLWQGPELSREAFLQLLDAQKPGMKHRSVLRAITNIYNPPVINDPYGYMAHIRNEHT